MELDWQVCSRARLSRDARFDGKFFIAVLTSKVYCRSICPAPTAQEKNVRYYSSAAAAAEAGFRPCLRCRPECSPGTPAWLGTPNTVSRALRLIAESGLEDGGVEVLADRLGVGSRHLRRLFLQYLGATPGAVAQTRRMHFAKKLIDETRLPMSEVASHRASVACAGLMPPSARSIIEHPRKFAGCRGKWVFRRRMNIYFAFASAPPMTGTACCVFWCPAPSRAWRWWRPAGTGVLFP